MNRNYNGLLVLFFVALLTSALFGGGPEPRIPVGSADIADDSVTNAKLAEPVSVANGGTGKTTAAEGLAALGGASLNGSSTVAFNASIYNAATGTAAAPAYSFGSDPDTGIYSPGANTLGFGVNSAENARISAGGNVLIATSTDDGSNKLQVNGGASFADRPIYTGGVDFRAYTSTIPTVANTEWLIATATAETYDISSSFNMATGIITIAANGLYYIDAKVVVNAPSAAGYAHLQIVDDPITTAVFSGTAYFPITAVSQLHIGGLTYLPAGSYKIRVLQTSGSAQSMAVLEIIMTQLRRF